MLKAKLMSQLKHRKGGEYVKEDGRYYWLYLDEKHIVTTGWLIHKLEEVNKELASPTPVLPKIVKVEAEEPKPEPKPETIVEQKLKKAPVKKKKEADPQ